jgi:peptidyl-prolyl cis-trans isomerase B (cyclophilin B)
MRNKGLIKRFLLLSLALFFITASGCAKAPSDTSKQQQNTNSSSAANEKPDKNFKSQYSGKKPLVTIEMEDGSKIKAELYPDIAPKTVDNFIALIQKGFYDGLIFHRVIPGFMIQGGDPNGNGTGGSDKTIPGEFTKNGFENNLDHTRGVLSMARSKDFNSASSQFFIMVKDYPSLNKNYASFGKVIEGMEIADKIVSVEKDSNDKPLIPQKMKKVTVEIQ